MPPNLNRNLEAKIESQKTVIQSFQEDLQSTQDSLNSWDEVNLNLIQGVYVDGSVGTSTSSVSRLTEPVISHLPQAVVTLSCFNGESIPCRRQQQNWLQLRVRHQRAFESASGNSQFFYPTTSLPTDSADSTVTVLDYGGPQKREAESHVIDQLASTSRI